MRSNGVGVLRSSLDSLGVFGSTLCVLHCLLGPAILLGGALLPTVFQDDEMFHQAMLWWVLPIGIVAFSLGCRRHKDVLTLLLGSAGLLGLLWAGVAAHDVLGETGEKFATLIAAAALIAAHWRNARLCRANQCQHENHVP